MQELSFIIDIKKSGDSCKYFEGTKKYIATADIIDDEIVSYTEVTYANKPSRANVIAKPGDVIFAKMQNTIKVIVVDEETSNYIYSTGFYCIQDDRYLPEFLKCYFMSKAFNEKKDKNCNGATMKALSDEGFKKIKLPLISKEVQKQIINEYIALSTSIKNKNKQISIFDELIKSQFIEMFGEEKCKKNNWSTEKLENITELITDGEHSTPKRTKQGIFLLSARNVLHHKLDLSDVDYISDKEYVRISKRIVPKVGDVLLTCSGSVGRSCVVKENYKFQLVRSVALLRFNTNIINPVYADYSLSSSYIQNQINGYKTASSQANIFQGSIKKITMYVTPKSLQDQFAAIVEQIDKSKLNGGIHCAIC